MVPRRGTISAMCGLSFSQIFLSFFRIWMFVSFGSTILSASPTDTGRQQLQGFAAILHPTPAQNIVVAINSTPLNGFSRVGENPLDGVQQNHLSARLAGAGPANVNVTHPDFPDPIFQKTKQNEDRILPEQHPVPPQNFDISTIKNTLKIETVDPTIPNAVGDNKIRLQERTATMPAVLTMTPAYAYATIATLLLMVQETVLFAFHQPPIAKSGLVKLWDGDVHGDGNSQHLSDWYTFSHIIHGFIFYGVLSYFTPMLPIEQRLIISLGVEIAWEIVENSPTVIDRYRKTALAHGYTGDSILNSVADTFAMAFGFILAHNLPAATIVGLAVAAEVGVAAKIRDNLTLNVIQLIHPFEAISKWQANGSPSR